MKFNARITAVAAVAVALAISGCATKLDVQGHRGARGLAPENTLAAFKTALALEVDTIETDVGVTRDGVVVIYHDRALNPDITRDASGAFLSARGPLVASLTFDELRRYDVGRINTQSNYGKPFAAQRAADGERVPKLSDLFDLVKATPRAAHVRFNIETKLTPLAPADTLPPDAFADALIAEIERAGMAARTSIQSFDWRTLQRVQTVAPHIATVYLSNEQGASETVHRGKPGASPWLAGFDVDHYGGSVAAAVKAAGGAIWSPNFRDIDDAIVRAAQALGLRVVPWTVNEPADIARVLSWRVDGIISDYPDRVRTARAAVR